MPKVSVLIPTYNRRELITQAIKSVLKQKFQDFEIIVVDDGSIDNTKDVVKNIKDDRIIYFYKQNGGLSSALNYGFRKVSGEYLAFLDDDDLWPENYLEVMISSLEKEKDFGLGYSLYDEYYPNGQVKAGFGADRYISGWFTVQYYTHTPKILPSACVLRKSVCDGIWQDENLKTYNDVDYFLRLSLKTQFLLVEEVCVRRRRTPNSLSENMLDYNAVRIFERFYKRLGGSEIISQDIYRKKISEHWRGLAKKHYRQGNRKAAIELYKKAISHCPYDFKNIRGLIKGVFLSKEKDKMPDWQMPKPLPGTINCSSCRLVDRD